MKLLLTFFIFFTLLSSLSAQQDETKQQNDTQVKSDVFSVSEIPAMADNTHQTLKKIRKEIKPQEAIVTIEKALKLVVDSLNNIQPDSLYKQLQSFYTRSLQNMRQEWLVYLDKLDDWKIVLQDRTEEMENYKKQIKKTYDEWDNTAKEILNMDIPETIQERVNGIKTEIDSTESLLSERINALLVMQNQISKQKLKIEDIVSRINQIIADKSSHIFIMDQPPLWNAFSAAEDTININQHIAETWGSFWKTLTSFAKTNRTKLYIHIILLIALFILIYYFYHLNKQQTLFNENDEMLRASAFFISRPFSAAFLIALFLSVLLYPDTTVTIGELLVAIILIPFQRLLDGAIVPERKKAVHILSGLYLFIFILNNIIDYPLLRRFFLLLITIITILLFIELIKSTYPLHKQRLKPWPRLVFIILPITIFLLSISVIANIIGSFILSLVLTEGIIKSIIIGVILYTTARVIDGLVILSIRKRVTHALHFVQTYAGKLEHWAVLVIHFFAFFIWIKSTLRAFHLLLPVQEQLKEIMATSWKFGKFVLSIQNIFDFFLILVLAFALSRLIRIILDVELFPRIHLPRGIPGAISMIIRYTIVGVGIFLAISSLGIDLGTFGLLAGTLGVGIGFGLQNVIANFVSGLILTFERPIQVGDKIEVGDVLGNVKQIGVRSSTVKTFDGSEVIVPNADLISNQVINWTLTDTRQRMKLPVKVAFESDPDQVLEILLKVVREHPAVLDDPEPMATFNGFGDYFLDFTLYYWITGNIFQTKTEVALGVHRSIKEAGIQKPKPQQEIQIMISEGLDNVKITNSSKKKK